MSAYRPRHLAPPSGTSRRSLLRGSALGAMALSAGTAAAIAPAAQAAGLYGQDVSGWQGRVDWAAQAAAGSRFSYVKATEGRSYRSPDFDHQYIGAGEAGLVRGGYHFARPDSGDPEEQVRSEEHTSELQSRGHLVCRLLLEKKNLTQPRMIV